MNATVTIDQVSTQVKTKIFKLSKDALVKKFIAGKFETVDEVVSASHYLNQRKSLTETEINRIQTTLYVNIFVEEKQIIDAENAAQPVVPVTINKDLADNELGSRANFGLHRSEMSDEQIVEAEDRHNKVVEQNKAKSTIESVETQIDPIVTKKVKTTKEKKPIDTPTIKLTPQEFKMFELITAQVIVDNPQLKQSIIAQSDLAEQIALGSLREFKGILSSLRKKSVVTYITDNDVELTQLSIDMINGTMPYREKNKNERNFFKKERLTQIINDKEVDKSSYVRGLLRKNKNISYAEIKEALEKAGYPKLYHSELQRCRVQLGIEVKKQD